MTEIKKITKMMGDTVISQNNKQSVFIDAVISDPEDIPRVLAKLSWKNLTTIQKIKKIQDYTRATRSKTRITASNVRSYKFKDILYDNSLQQIIEVNITRK